MPTLYAPEAEYVLLDRDQKASLDECGDPDRPLGLGILKKLGGIEYRVWDFHGAHMPALNVERRGVIAVDIDRLPPETRDPEKSTSEEATRYADANLKARTAAPEGKDGYEHLVETQGAQTLLRAASSVVWDIEPADPENGR